MDIFGGNIAEQYAFVRIAGPVALGMAVFLVMVAGARKFLFPEARWDIIESITQQEGLTERLDGMIYRAGLSDVMDVPRLYQLMFAIFVVSSIPFVLSGTLLGVIPAAGLALAIPLTFMGVLDNRRQAVIDEQLVSFFNEMAAGMRVGEKPQVAFLASIERTEEPLFGIMLRIDKNVRTLGDFPEALERSRTYISSNYYQDFVDAVQINEESGGNLSLVVRNVIQQINERKIALKQFQAAMAEINGSMAFIFLSPPVLTWLMVLQNPQTKDVLLGTTIGFVTLAAAGMLYVGAIAFAAKERNNVTKNIG